MQSRQGLSHDDYCLIIGKLYIDAFQSVRSLEKRNASLHESFQHQLEELRGKVQDGDMGEGIPRFPDHSGRDSMPDWQRDLLHSPPDAAASDGGE